MNVADQVRDIDAKIAKGKFESVTSKHYDKGVEVHVQNFAHLTGKSASKSLERFAGVLGDGATIEVLATRAIDDEQASVSLYSFDTGTESEARTRLMMLVARRYSDNGKIKEEEYLPVRNTTDAQPYFPQTRLPNKQIQPRLSFVTPTRKRRAKGGGRPRKPTQDTDLHLLPTIGKTVVAALNEAGLSTFELLSKATDDVLEAVRSVSGRRFTNFDSTYWREAAGYAVRGEFDKIPAPPKAKAKQGKRGVKVDFSNAKETDLHKLPKVGPNMLQAMHARDIETFKDLANADDDTLEALRIEGGRPFVNFDMNYFRDAAKAIVGGAQFVPDPPKPASKAKGPGRGGRKPREINPNDLHILPGVGAQLVKALHERDVNTFADLANADKSVLADARAQTKGKYKNIDLTYLQRQAARAAAGKYERIDPQVKIEKSKEARKQDPQERHMARLAAASKHDLEVLPGIGKSVKEAMNAAGIKTFAQLANAKADRLKEIANNAGRRFARFDVEFWRKVAAHAQAGEFDQVPLKPPTAPKPPKTKRAPGEPRQARPPRTPRDQKDLGALPTIGKTIIAALQDAKINTFTQLANASDEKLQAVRDASGPKYKTFDINYWRTVAGLAKEGTYEYPDPPRKEKKAKTGRRGRAPKEIENTDLRALAGVGASLASALRQEGLKTFEDIANAETWRIMKAGEQAGKRFKRLNPAVLQKAARDAMAGKFPEPKKRESKKSSLPEGADKLRAIPGIGAKVQEKLFERGVLTYSDLAKSTIGTLEEVRNEVGRRVAKADVRVWKEKAKLAANGDWAAVDAAVYGDEQPAKAPAKAKRPKAPKDGDNLTKIKGIGPQAQQMFRTRGVKTYRQLVELSDDALMALLEESGARVKPEDFEKVRQAAAKQMSKSSK